MWHLVSSSSLLIADWKLNSMKQELCSLQNDSAMIQYYKVYNGESLHVPLRVWTLLRIVNSPLTCIITGTIVVLATF